MTKNSVHKNIRWLLVIMAPMQRMWTTSLISGLIVTSSACAPYFIMWDLWANFMRLQMDAWDITHCLHFRLIVIFVFWKVLMLHLILLLSMLLLPQTKRTALMKAETKARTLKRFLLSQKHIVYTEPLDVQAGSTVTVFYNPANTVLNGKSEVWFRGSFNRWTHRKGPLSPQRMLPADSGTHIKTTGKLLWVLHVLVCVLLNRDFRITKK